MIDTTLHIGYAPVNGLEMYYEIHGTGQPLILIHGGFGAAGMFADLIPALAQTCQVIAVDLQAHGHTADIDRPLRLELMADDIAALIQHLGHEKADVSGYSLGGGVALQTAIRHPDRVRTLAVMSAPYKSDGWYPEMRAGMGQLNAEALKGTIMHSTYLDVAPRPDDWPVLVGKLKELMTSAAYDWTAEVRGLKMPALLIAGDADSFPPAHLVEMFGLLGGGQRDGGWDRSEMPNAQLAILPGTTHYEIPDRVDLLLPILTPFLSSPMPERA